VSQFEIHPEYKALLSNCDWLVDGPFILEKRSLMLKFRGSTNQRILDVKKSLETMSAVDAEI
jgi:anaerobic ribonucleoside-triphosphate reductase activating protein